MDRRDFLKLFAITAAGIYVPRRSYFFMSVPKIIECSFGPSKFSFQVHKGLNTIFIGGKRYVINGEWALDQTKYLLPVGLDVRFI